MSTVWIAANAACPCDSGRRYTDCCGPLHSGGVALNATALMRSRYSANVLLLGDYLQASWHASTRPAVLDLDAATRWLGLRIVASHHHDADHATVEFIARLRHGGGRAQRLHEISRFVCEDKRWYYVDGEFPAA